MAVIYCKYGTGSTTYSLTALTGAIASNPSGTITRITYNSHGLVNGQVVILTLFSTWLNRAWTVTNVATNTFDLLEAVWQTTADNNGTVNPLNGYSWATAIKEPQGIFGNIQNNAKPEIEIRVEKTGDPTSIGNATWVNGQSYITLATAQTATIDNCETAWTAANTATVTRTTTTPIKQGSFNMTIQVPATPATSTKYAYYPLPATLDLSAYQQISYWLKPSATNAIDADTEYKICLCSDTTGDTIVDEFFLKRNSNSSNYGFPFVITKNGGGNLGASIKSIALYTNTTTPTGSTSILLDNIIATKTNGLNLTSIISKCSSATYDHTKDPWFPIDYIDGTTVELSTGFLSTWNQSPSNLYKYITSGTATETVTTYIRPLINYEQTGFNYSVLATPYNADNYFIVNGGWNSSTDTLDGMTFIQNYQTGIYGVPNSTGSTSAYNRNTLLKNLGLVRFAGLSYENGNWQSNKDFENLYVIHTFDRTYSANTFQTRMENVSFAGNTSNAGFELNQTNSTFNNIKWYGFSRCSILLEKGTFKNFYGITASYSSSPVSGLALSDNVLSDNITFQSPPSLTAQTGNIGVSILTLSSSTLPVINGLIIKNTHNAVFTSGNAIINKANFQGNVYSCKYSSDGQVGVVVFNNLTSTDTNFTGVNSATYSAYAQKAVIINNAPGGDKNSVSQYYKMYGQPAVGSTAWGATVFAQTSVRHTASGIAWQINPLTNYITETYPFQFKIASIAVNSSSTVTVKAWLKLSHASDIGAKLFIPGGQISGPTSDTSATKSADTNWEELTVTFTPSIQGVVDIYVEAYWKANLADESVYVDDITVTQA
jgi:hypothetical protein